MSRYVYDLTQAEQSLVPTVKPNLIRSATSAHHQFLSTEILMWTIYTTESCNPSFQQMCHTCTISLPENHHKLKCLKSLLSRFFFLFFLPDYESQLLHSKSGFCKKVTWQTNTEYRWLAQKIIEGKIRDEISIDIVWETTKKEEKMMPDWLTLQASSSYSLWYKGGQMDGESLPLQPRWFAWPLCESGAVHWTPGEQDQPKPVTAASGNLRCTAAELGPCWHKDISG